MLGCLSTSTVPPPGAWLSPRSSRRLVLVGAPLSNTGEPPTDEFIPHRIEFSFDIPPILRVACPA